MITAVTALLMLTALPASAAFQIDMPPEEVRKENQVSLLFDLAVGEKGIISFPSFCADDDTLFAMSTTKLFTERSDYGVSWIATRHPGGDISFQVEKGSKNKDSLRSSIVFVFETLRGGDHPMLVSLPRARVAEINGMTTVSAVMSMAK